jgi:glycosyltransferase involved in cell wall biosynthesis
LKKTNKLSVLLITYNEIDNIKRCIESISFADEIVVVDSYSTDGTWEFLQSQKSIRCFQNPFENFTQQKSYTLSLATYDWVYFIDADEEITASLQKEIQTTINNTQDIAAYWNYREFMFDKKPLRFGGCQNDKIQRLFKKSVCYFDPNLTVHEKLIVNGKEGTLSHKIIHYCYKNYDDFKDKTIKYGRMSAVDRYKKGTRYHFILAKVKPVWKFITRYIFKFGILDGKNGVIFAYLSALGITERYKELKKLSLQQDTSETLKMGYEAKRIFHNKSGLGNYSRNLVSKLSSYFPEHSYFLYNPKKPSSNLFKTNNQNVFEKRPTSAIYKFFYNYWRQKGIVKDLVKDGVHVYHGLSGELPAGLKKNNIKSVVTIHDLIFLNLPKLYPFIDRKIYTYKSKKAAKNADLIIAISKQTKNDIVKFYGVNSSKIKVIYQGCDPVFDGKFNAKECENTLSKYNLPKNYILNVGTIEERKNLLIIVKAISSLDTHLVVVGKETPYTKIVKDYITKYNMESKVHFVKNIESNELAILYQCAKIFVYPSIYEGFGIPIIEAMMSKTPVITTKGGVFEEVGGQQSVYVNPFDADELRVAIQKLLTDPETCKKMIDEGSKHVQKFNNNKVTREVFECYKELLSNPE